MRTIRFGDGTRFGDLNAYWGSPSYVLEPGDENYRVPPPPPGTLLQTKSTHKNMSSNATPTNRTILTALQAKDYGLVDAILAKQTVPDDSEK